MIYIDWLLRLLVVTGLGLTWFCYGRGWQRWRRVAPGLATPRRLFALSLATLLILLAFFPPLDLLSRQLLFARSLQKIALAFWAAPLFWLAAPFHLIAVGLPFPWRQRLTRWLRPQQPMGKVLRMLTQPAVIWLAFVSAIVMWHDPVVVNWTMARPPMHLLSMLILLGIALLYWGQLVGTEPRLRKALPGWVLFAYVVGVEVPNMATGMTIAYSAAPFYTYYAAIHQSASLGMGVISDQMISGGLIWFTGSFVFFPSAVLILNRLFRQHDGNLPQHFPDWDSDERMIAPGLEHRLKEPR
ncbi:MAG: cytochrome c oxidase assembly protein [Caldilineaceae bacterium]|nr:cytochrome c oxidase assembly protein [Caldilineaceae bacterium]